MGLQMDGAQEVNELIDSYEEGETRYKVSLSSVKGRYVILETLRPGWGHSVYLLKPEIAKQLAGLLLGYAKEVERKGGSDE